MLNVHLELHDIQSTSLLEDRVLIKSLFARLVDDCQVRYVGRGLEDVGIFVLCRGLKGKKGNKGGNN